MIEIGDIGSAPIQNVLEIKDVNNIVKCRYVMGKNDALTKELMNRNDISISFNYPTFVKFKKGDYIVHENERYTLMKDFKATENKGEYRYELVFHAKEMLIQDAQYFYTNSNIHQSEFTLTGNAQYFFQLAVEDINAHFGANFVNLGSIESTDIKQITFASNTNVFNALHQVCEVFGLEYLFAGDTINASKKVNFGDAIDFKVGESILSVNRREGDNVFTANRILALGSTTNLTRDYQGGDYMIGSKRLRIPQSEGTFIDLKEGLQPTEIETAVVIFDDVFPHRIGNVDEVREVEYEDKDEDGNDIILKQWRFKDNEIIFSEDYLLPNEPLMLVFESGRLAGQHFEVAFRKGNYNETDNSQNYEILLNDRGLPNDTLYPQVGDKYVLYNFNIALVSNIYIPEAENELYDTAVQWLKEQHTDKGVYECSIMTDYARTNDANLEIGQRVNLFAPMFDANKRESRIMGYVKPLLDWSTATYTIGDNAAYSPKSNIQQRITKLEAFEYVDAGVGSASGSVYIIKQFDLTRPTDFNVYSAKATDAMYFNRQKGGSVLGDTLFTKNVQTQGVNVSNVFQNSTFTAGAFGTGMQFKNDANGYSYGELDYLRVRKEMIVSQLTIDEIKSVGGTILLSLANLTASNVVDNGTSYRVYFDNQDGKLLNQFAVGDQAIRQTFNGTNIVRYWRLVTGVGIDYIDLSKTDAEQGSSVPLVGDEIIQLGNRTNAMRQHAIMLSAYGSDAPSIKQYSGINSFSFLNKEVTVISPSGNKFKGTFEITSNGTTTAVYKDRGKFVNGTTYYKYDRVSHNGSLWVCNVTSTTVTPNESTMAWIKETSGQKDIDNAISDIKIGAINLADNSNFIYGFTGWGYHQASRELIDDAIFSKIAKVTKTPSASYGQLSYNKELNRENGDVYTTTIYIKADAPTSVMIAQEGSPITSKLFDVSTEWRRYSISGVWNKANRNILMFWTDKDVPFYVANLMYESGNIPSSWRPSLYDTQQQINEGSDANDYINSVIKGQIEAIQDQLDGKVNSYFYDYDPTLTNIPASEWTNDQLKSEHLNDTFTNTTSGKSWRWAKENNVYKWIEITDTAALEALQKAQEALNIANDKMQVFVTTPYTPYKIGDLWVQGTIGDIMKCKTTRLTGNYVVSDWDRASKYTDDTKANQVGDDLEQLSTQTTTKFQVLEDEINAKVDSQTFDQLDQLVQTHSSQITQLDNSITSTVEKVDNIQVGGVNLIQNSNFSNGLKYWNNFYASYSVISDSKFGNVARLLKYTSQTEGGMYASSHLDILVNGQMYIVTLYLKADAPSVINVGQESGFTKLLNITTEWQKYTISGVWNRGTYNGFIIRSRTNSPFYVANVMYEVGNMPSSWSPAPQDYLDEIDSKAQTFYQDNEPTTKNVGDIWIKKALVDTNGVVNTDQSKNIYQLQMRWDGSTWQRINWSASKSKVEQTDNRITLEVNRLDGEIDEKTNITLTDNKISLAGKTIELKGSTIADSIEAEDLIVGTNSTPSQLKVMQDGAFYARGSKATDESLVVDSDKQEIVLKTKKSATQGGADITENSTIQISREVGGFSARTDSKATIVSTSGVFANFANQGGQSAVTGNRDYSAIVGLGFNSVPRDYNEITRTEHSQLVGVFGSANNQLQSINKAPAYGGMFNVLCARGLVMGLKRVFQSYEVSIHDTFISCDNTVPWINITIKGDDYVGRCIYFRANIEGISITSGRTNVIDENGTKSNKAVLSKNKLGIIVFDGVNWLFNVVG